MLVSVDFASLSTFWHYICHVNELCTLVHTEGISTYTAIEMQLRVTTR